MIRKNKWAHIVGSVARELLALTFIFSGAVKAIDPLGTVYKIEDYLKAFGGFFTSWMDLAGVAAVVLITLEFTIGVCLLLNIRTQWTSWLTLLFYVVMTPLTLYVAIANPVSDCGCFGEALVISNWATFWKNIVLLTLAVVLMATKRHIPDTFVWQAEVVIALLATLLVLGSMEFTRRHLPVADFRPYKIGNNIPELMDIPIDAPQDKYDVTLIYSKDGVEQEFTLENYPKGDSTWTFVDQRSVLVQKGYEPPIHDFEILNSDYEDITYDILESDIPQTLVIMYDLHKADKTLMDRVTALYYECLWKEEPFYILTGSGEQDIEAFCEQVDDGMTNTLTPFNHPDAVFCTCDPVTLKTIVRANPGVIVVKDGVIIDKYNLRNKNITITK